MSRLLLWDWSNTDESTAEEFFEFDNNLGKHRQNLRWTTFLHGLPEGNYRMTTINSAKKEVIHAWDI